MEPKSLSLVQIRNKIRDAYAEMISLADQQLNLLNSEGSVLDVMEDFEELNKTRERLQNEIDQWQGCVNDDLNQQQHSPDTAAFLKYSRSTVQQLLDKQSKIEMKLKAELSMLGEGISQLKVRKSASRSYHGQAENIALYVDQKK